MTGILLVSQKQRWAEATAGGKLLTPRGIAPEIDS
jgi:hypothetical protein